MGRIGLALILVTMGAFLCTFFGWSSASFSPQTILTAENSSELPTLQTGEIPRAVLTPQDGLSAPLRVTPTISTTRALVECGRPGSRDDWKFFSSTTSQFGLRYPPTMMVVTRTQRAANILESTRFLLPRDINTPQPNEINLTIFDNPHNLSTEGWFEAHRKRVEGSAALFENVTNLRHCSVDNLAALMFQETIFGSVHRILVSKANRVFSILVVDYDNPEWMKDFLAMVATMRWNANAR